MCPNEHVQLKGIVPAKKVLVFDLACWYGAAFGEPNGCTAVGGLTSGEQIQEESCVILVQLGCHPCAIFQEQTLQGLELLASQEDSRKFCGHYGSHVPVPKACLGQRTSPTCSTTFVSTLDSCNAKESVLQCTVAPPIHATPAAPGHLCACALTRPCEHALAQLSLPEGYGVYST
jgi:hypothetical protein